MPALQVRDFPDELYEQLKAYAASQHRSVAQQTIVAVEQMLAHPEASRYWNGERLYRAVRPIPDYDTEEERAARIEKRKKLFARIEKLPKFELPEGFPSTAELIRQGHEERDRRTLGAAGFDDGYGEVITR